jgi:hypothetical protein
MAAGVQEQFDALFDLQDASVDEDDLLLLEGDLAEHGRLGLVQGHGSNNVVHRVQIHRHGHEALGYFKPANGLSIRTLDLFRQTRASSTLGEAAAWRLAVALGEPYRDLVAPCVVRFLDEIDDGPGALSLHRPGEIESDEPIRRLLDVVCDAAFFDCLIGQQDRHSGNWLWDADGAKLALIDHGCAFARRGDPCNRQRLASARRAHGRLALTERETDIAERLRDSADLLGLAAFLDQDRTDSLRARAAAMAAKPKTVLRRGDFR